MKKSLALFSVLWLCFNHIAYAKINLQLSKGSRTLDGKRDRESQKYEGKSEEISLLAHWLPSDKIPAAIGMGFTSVSEMSLAYKNTVDPLVADYLIIKDGKGYISSLEIMFWLPTFWKFTVFGKAGANFGELVTGFQYLDDSTKTSYKVQGTHFNLGVSWGWPLFSIFGQADKASDTLSASKASGFLMPNQLESITLESLAWSGGFQTRF